MPKKRLTFARQNLKRNWDNIIFWDETSVQLISKGNKKNDICYQNAINLVPYQPKVKHSLKVNVAGGISQKGKPSLFIFTETHGLQFILSNLGEDFVAQRKKIIWSISMGSFTR